MQPAFQCWEPASPRLAPDRASLLQGTPCARSYTYTLHMKHASAFCEYCAPDVLNHGDAKCRKAARVITLQMQDKLVREYDMKFGFCVPRSVNAWQAEYDMPLYTEAQAQAFVRSAPATTSACHREPRFLISFTLPYQSHDLHLVSTFLKCVVSQAACR